MRTESYRLRSAAWSAFYRFRLTTADNELTKLGWSAVEEAAHVANATDEAELRERGERAREFLEDFVAVAARQLEANAVDNISRALLDRRLGVSVTAFSFTGNRLDDGSDAVVEAQVRSHRLYYNA